VTIRFLVDDCVIGPIARALADAGYDLAFVAGASAGLSDTGVAARASEDGRVIVTQDYDFGELAVRDALPAAERVERVRAVLGSLVEPLEGHLTIVEPRRLRRRALR
jgi:hypothetical protein